MYSTATFFLVALPWLNPFSLGPMAIAVQMLFSWSCFAGLLGIGAYSSGRVWATRGGVPIVQAWLAAALVSALLGLLQYFGATSMFGAWISSGALGEAYGNLRQRNQFATLINMGLAVSLCWGVSAANVGTNRREVMSMAATLLLATGNAASSSRTGLVQMVALAVMWPIWISNHHGDAKKCGWYPMVVAFLAYGLAAIGLPLLAGLDPHATGILARLQDVNSACASRLTLWNNVLHLIAQKPWLGWGWGELDYAHFITLYPGTRFCDILDNAHNLPLHLAVELGVPLVAVPGQAVA